MRFTRFLAFGRSEAAAVQDTNEASQIEDLDVFLSEKAAFADIKPSPRKRSPRSRSRLVPFVAALAIVEAVPAGLWLQQTFAVSEARAAGTTPTHTVPTSVALSAPCEVPPAPAPVESSAPVAAKGTARSVAAATAGSRVPPPSAGGGSIGGLVAVTAPVPMRIYLRGRVVGTTEAETIMLPVGKHDLEFVSDEVGYKARRSVAVQAGRTATIRLEAPVGTVHVNATPWAEVWVDNRRLGETPIGNLQVPIGVREFVFRHPELGERRKTALVTLKEPVRISMDLRSK